MEEYKADVKWLREHVARDDIYDFAQQAIMAGMYFIGKLKDVIDVQSECENDEQFANYCKNFLAIIKMKKSGTNQMLDMGFVVQEYEDNNSG